MKSVGRDEAKKINRVTRYVNIIWMFEPLCSSKYISFICGIPKRKQCLLPTCFCKKATQHNIYTTIQCRVVYYLNKNFDINTPFLFFLFFFSSRGGQHISHHCSLEHTYFASLTSTCHLSSGVAMGKKVSYNFECQCCY